MDNQVLFYSASCRGELHMSSGNFVKGDPRINRKGRSKNADKDLLRAALEREGIKRGINFWDKVAEVAYTDKGLMTAVCKKFVPDMSSTEHSGEINVNEMPTVKINGEEQEIDIGSDPGNSSDSEDSSETTILLPTGE